MLSLGLGVFSGCQEADPSEQALDAQASDGSVDASCCSACRSDGPEATFCDSFPQYGYYECWRVNQLFHGEICYGLAGEPLCACLAELFRQPCELVDGVAVFTSQRDPVWPPLPPLCGWLPDGGM